MSRSCLLALCIAASCAVSACSSVYRMQGIESASVSEIAVVETPLGFAEFAGVSEVDGRPKTLDLTNRYELVPGARTLTVRLVKGGVHSGPLKVKFTAAAGETYQLLYETQKTTETSGTWTTWVINKRSGERVSEVVK
jgi:hypothetical protein